MGRIPDEIIQQVRDRVDILDLVSRFVHLRAAGRNHKGLCPFHDEKTPSFVVTPERGTYKCFGCDEGGDVFAFVMKMENLAFPEAIRTLAAEHGIEIPETGGEADATGPLYRANEVAQACYREALAKPGNPAAAYLAQRGIEPELAERFEIGFAPDRWDGVAEALRKAGVPAEAGERAGLLRAGRSGSRYDFLRNRVTFPIRDVRGRVVAFGGRALADDQEPKYLNGSESPVFAKRRAFFGFPAALEPIRRAGRAVVVEGYFDLLALHRAGVPETLATCGTALTEEHARDLRRRTPKVVILFDGDEAGQKAMERSLEVLLPAGLRVHAAVLPAGVDPDDLVREQGPAALERLVDQAPPALDVAIRRATARGCASPAEKADAVASVAPLLVKLPSPVERGAYEEQLAMAVGANADDVRAAVRAARKGEDPRDAVPVAVRVEPAEVRKLRLLALSLVEHPHLAAQVARDPLDELGEHPVLELVRRLVWAAGQDRRADLEEISEGLSGEARSLLYALVAEDHPPEEDAAARTVADTNAWLARRRETAAQQELTSRLRSGGADALEILRAKQGRAVKQTTPPPIRGRPH